ncbi:MAG: hypothetical protein WCJ60_04435 [bacterium]
MILQILIVGIVTFIGFIISLVPAIPAVPTIIATSGEWIITQVIGLVSVLRVIYGSALLTAIVLVAVTLLNFDYAYNIVMWIYRKIRG